MYNRTVPLRTRTGTPHIGMHIHEDVNVTTQFTNASLLRDWRVHSQPPCLTINEFNDNALKTVLFTAYPHPNVRARPLVSR